jgi:hypothetical protein
MKRVNIIFQNFEPTPIITVLVKVDDDLKVCPPQFLLIGIDNYRCEIYKG